MNEVLTGLERMSVNNEWHNFHFWVNYPFKTMLHGVKFESIWISKLMGHMLDLNTNVPQL